MLTYGFLQEYLWLVVSITASIFAFFMFIHAGSGLLFALGRDERERTLITDAIGRKWVFQFFDLAIFIIYAFTAFPGFQQDDAGNGFLFWIFFIMPFTIHAAASEVLYRKPSSTRLRKVCQWIMVVLGWVIPYLMGFFNCAFYTGTGNPISLLNVFNGFFGITYTATGALLYLHMMIDDKEIDRRIIRILPFASIFLILSAVVVCYLILSMEGLEYGADGMFYPVHLKYMTNLLALPHSLGCSILGICLILSSIVNTLLFSTKWSFGMFAAGSLFLLSSFIQIAGFNNTPVFPCYSDPQRSLSLANSCADQTTLLILAISSVVVIPLLLTIIIRLWRRVR